MKFWSRAARSPEGLAEDAGDEREVKKRGFIGEARESLEGHSCCLCP